MLRIVSSLFSFSHQVVKVAVPLLLSRREYNLNNGKAADAVLLSDQLCEIEHQQHLVFVSKPLIIVKLRTSFDVSSFNRIFSAWRCIS
jgi:hypothetical protein